MLFAYSGPSVINYVIISDDKIFIDEYSFFINSTSMNFFCNFYGIWLSI